MLGRVYLERGQPVTVLTRWRKPEPCPVPSWFTWDRKERPAPRNVLVRRADGSMASRPFRGLRKPKERGDA